MDRVSDRAVDGATRVMQLFGERWTFLILREAFFGVRRFNEMQRNLGIPRNMLADRLAKLVDGDIMERRQYRESPDFFEYHLTAQGLALYPAILAFIDWGDRHLSGDGVRRLDLEHRLCGQRADPKVVCRTCGEEIHARDVRVGSHEP